MSVGRYTAIVDQVRDLTPQVRELTLRLVDPLVFVFAPGQSICLEISSARTPQPIQRYYSLASPPSQPSRLVLLLSVADQGPGSSYMFNRKEGEEIQFLGPKGSFCLREDVNRDILFVATGTGIAPFRSMLHDLFERQFTNAVTLFWGLRSEDNVYYQDELDALAQQHPNFSFVMTLSRSERNWTEAKGRVTQLVEKIQTVDNLAVYICGNKRMVTEVTKIVRKKGDCLIYREQFFDEMDSNSSA